MSWNAYRLRRRDNPILRSRTAPHGFAEKATWLAEDVLWVEGWLTTSSGRPLACQVEIDGQTLEAEARRFTYGRPDLQSLPGATGQIFVLRLAPLPERFASRDCQTLGRLHLRLDDTWYRLTGSHDLAVAPDLESTLPFKAPYLTPETRLGLAEFLAESGQELGLDDDPLFERNRSLWIQLLVPQPEPGEAENGVETPGEVEEEANGESTEEPTAPEEDPEGTDPIGLVLPEPSGTEVEVPTAEEPGPVSPPPVEEEPEPWTESGEMEPLGEEIPEIQEPEPPLPTSIADPQAPVGLAIDRVVAADERTLLIQGWHWDRDGLAEALRLHLAWDEAALEEANGDPTSELGPGDDLGLGSGPDLDPVSETEPESDPSLDSEAESGPDSGSEAEPGSDLAPGVETADVETADVEIADIETADIEKVVEPANGDIGPIRSFDLDRVWTSPRGDVAEFFEPAFGPVSPEGLGFLALAELPEHDGPSPRLSLEHAFRDQEGARIAVPRPIDDPVLARELLLQMTRPLGDDSELFERFVEPTLSKAQRRLAAATSLEPVVTAPDRLRTSAPRFSLLVWVDSLDWLEHQMASLADDPELAKAELLYGLTHPEQAASMAESLHHLALLYGLDASAFVATQPCGPARGLDLLAEQARGQWLVWLEPDTLAYRPGWLSRLAEAASRPDTGVVGPKLLDANGSIAHSGVDFVEHLDPRSRWWPQDALQGFHPALAAADREREVTAIAGGCLMIAAERYAQLEGLSGDYIGGQLESHDLCLRSLEAGWTNRYVPTELYHLGGLDRPTGDGWGRNSWSEVYNRWLFNRRWSEFLELRALPGSSESEP